MNTTRNAPTQMPMAHGSHIESSRTVHSVPLPLPLHLSHGTPDTSPAPTLTASPGPTGTA